MWKIENSALKNDNRFRNHSNPGRESSSSSPQSESSISSSPLGPFNRIPRPTSFSSHSQERDGDFNISRKRSYSDSDDRVKDNKLKKETYDQVIKKENCDSGGNGNANEIPEMKVQDMARASQQMAMHLSHQQMGIAMPQQPQMMHQQANPYPYGYSASKSYMHPNQAAYSKPPMMAIASHNTTLANASNVASNLGNGFSNEMGMVASSISAMIAFPCVNVRNNNGSIYQMLPYPNYARFPVVNNVDAIVPMFNNLEPIILTNAVLTPPLPGERPSRRPKPPGCRTVYVGNMPEKMTEEIVEDSFKICGPISVVRMNKKNFCHIRFEQMESVDQAILLSGFRIRIEKNEDPAYNGKLHVDYNIDRVDQHEYESLERARLREERHREAQREAFRAPFPPPVPYFSDSGAQALAERLRNEETFRNALHVLITWLERGECYKRNSGTFYSLIQSSHSRVKRLKSEIEGCEDEVEKANENLLKKHRDISTEITEMEKVDKAARTQKVWDHFTRSQRKKIEEMKMETNDLKKTNSDFLIGKRDEQAMDLSDNEECNNNLENRGMVESSPAKELNTLRKRVNCLVRDLEVAQQNEEKYKKLCSEYQVKNAKLRFELEESKKHGSFVGGLSFVDAASQSSACANNATGIGDIVESASAGELNTLREIVKSVTKIWNVHSKKMILPNVTFV